MLKKKFSRYFGLFNAVILLAGFFPVSYLSISSGALHCNIRSKYFSLRWRHSVEKQLWYEHYRHQANQFELFESWLQTFGAGTPSYTTAITNAPQGYIGYKHQIRVNELNWVVSPSMEGTFLVEHKEIPLYQYLPEYSVVHIQSKRAPFWFYLLRSSCNVSSKNAKPAN
ncbi:DUF1850 domain-containing protein [Bibersteinia trehalosi]|uniref:DUF1850 domain-containing protein n=1 Tax=Bibersteinia trehalosi TaxID=47735 RepID=A0A3R8LB67_BIBTR|nr:DUF1850 domain-containing protein [Bibersteinia trehalosi]RRN02576.1 DUF1850 domain-containing protein [Bibersteinia trehalosi]